ncbi:hypothetical protein BKA66DRAFT_441310 [Pyrenochaeta sp. MPI-SDFR-AT-0127]|nr:hypothetical protein BKA66DRAFT_441310 [Pyrenochaeta sp. MPI-SDFR-AT-0127]
MLGYAPIEWPLATIRCLSEALSPYCNQNLSSGTEQPGQIRDIINLFVHLSLIAYHAREDRIQSTTKDETQQAWQKLCMTQLEKTRARSVLKSRDLKRLMKIDVEELWVLVTSNMMVYNTPDRKDFCRLIRGWLIGCARESLIHDSGNALRESLGRIQALQAWVIDAPIDGQQHVLSEIDTRFPELIHALWGLRPDQPQLDDCIEATLQHFLKVAFTALDIYGFYRPYKDDPEPCKCQLDFGVSKCSEALEFKPECTIRLPVYIFRVLSKINLRRSFDFLFTQVIPSLYLIRPDEDHALLGFRLYQWFAGAAGDLMMDGVAYRIHAVLRKMSTAERLTERNRRNFRPLTLSLPVPMNLLDRQSAEEAARRNGEALVDVPIVPCGPLIDIQQHSSPVPILPELEQPCVICRQAFEEADCSKLDVCDHIFHVVCIAKWMNTRTRSVTCPICRASICEPRTTRRGCTFCE